MPKNQCEDCKGIKKRRVLPCCKVMVCAKCKRGRFGLDKWDKLAVRKGERCIFCLVALVEFIKKNLGSSSESESSDDE